jgi:putative transposase
VKTLEFKIYPQVAQAQTIDLWLDDLRWVWNKGLSLKFAARQKYYREKVVGDRPIPESMVLKWKWRKIKTTDKQGKVTDKWEKVRLVGSGIVRPKNRYPYCEIRQYRNLEEPDKFKFTRNDLAPKFIQDIPSKYRDAVIDSLKKAWKAYSNPNQPTQKPKFKRKHDRLRSLANLNAGGVDKALKPESIPGSTNGYVHFPRLGKLYIKGLFARHDWQDWGIARIVKEPSGYYLHVCVDTPNIALPFSDRAVGIDPGLISVLTTDKKGRGVSAPKLYRKQQSKLKRLQRKTSRQLKGSNGQKKTSNLIALQHEKIRRSRNAFNHKLSTKIVREYGAIALEDIQVKNLSRKPKPKMNENGFGYAHNGASRKAGLNKSFADSALGDLLSKIETKAASADREFIRVPAHYTSIDCSQCGAQIEKSLSTRTHRCTECGFTDSRDGNAGKNILLKGRKSFERIYRTWDWETSMETLRKVKQDETVSSPSSGTSSNGETLSRICGEPPEAVKANKAEAVPESEHDSQLPILRGSVDVNFADPLKTPSNPCNATDFDLPLFATTRAPYESSNSAISENISHERKKKKRRSAKIEDESFIQLSLWDAIDETAFERGG